MGTLPVYFLAAFAEIGGCFAFWAWLRLGKPALWLAPGMASLPLSHVTREPGRPPARRGCSILPASRAAGSRRIDAPRAPF